jgi:nucleoside-diphosphate-sugar epimerase
MYGASKLLAEETCKIYHNVFGLDVTIGRMTNIYGPNQHNASQKTAAFNWMVKTCVEDGVISLYDNGKIKRDYLFISDAVNALMKLSEKGDPGKVYFIGSGEGVSFRDMVSMMIQAAGNRGHTRWVDSPGFHQRVGIGDFWCDNSEMKKLGWRPLVPLKDGIRRTVEFYK